MSALGDRMEQLGIDSQEDPDQMKCFGDACQNCKRFLHCPMHQGDEGAEL